MRRSLIISLIGLWLAFAGSTSAIAAQGTDAVADANEETAATKLIETASDLKEFIQSTNKKINDYQKIAQDKIQAAKQARTIVEQTITDLDALIARFDVEGDIRKAVEDAKAFSQKKATEYKNSKNETLRKIAPRFEKQATDFTQLEADAAGLVASAFEQKRRMVDAQEAIVALEEARMMDDVILVFNDSLKEFKGVIDATKGFVDNVEKTTTGGAL